MSLKTEECLSTELLQRRRGQTQPHLQRSLARWHMHQSQSSFWWPLVTGHSTTHLLPHEARAHLFSLTQCSPSPWAWRPASNGVSGSSNFYHRTALRCCWDAEGQDGPLSQRLLSLKWQKTMGCSLQMSEGCWVYFTLHDLYKRCVTWVI